MSSDTQATHAAKRDTAPTKGSSCASGLPFCGLGDTECLANRFAACSGLDFVEQVSPLRAKDSSSELRS
jgi:hypothetical protein